MKQTDPQLKLRLPPLLMDQIRQAAESGRRTLSAEIIGRLETSFKRSVTVTPPVNEENNQADLATRLTTLEVNFEEQIPPEAILDELSLLEKRVKAIEAVLHKVADG